ncbi:MAG: hypothetical protein OXC19_06495 [Bryobacterales bacterium]|nr:hypothetical protein [Bryobacterales bacterium]
MINSSSVGVAPIYSGLRAGRTRARARLPLDDRQQGARGTGFGVLAGYSPIDHIDQRFSKWGF